METNKIKFLILDVYPDDNWRLVKDTAGGYGTGNDFGNSIISKTLNFFVSKMISMPQMYALYIHSILKQKWHSVEYTKQTNNQKLIDEADYIIMPSSIIAHETEKKIVEKLSKENKKIFVVGIFANVLKKNYEFKNSHVVIGEPENFFLNLDYSKSNMETFFDESKTQNYANKMVDNLDDLPFPDWEYYTKRYPLKNNFLDFNSKTAIPILASRGCPYSCFNYCTYPLQQGRKVRYRSVENIIEEIKHWKKNLNTNKFIFRDPVFSINRKFTVDLCERIIEENLDIVFLVETHLNNLDDALIRLLSKAGLKMVYVGVESYESDVLKDISRFTVSNDEVYNIIKKLEESDIIVKSMFMFGSPTDTVQTIKNTINYSKHLTNQLVQYSIFTPYPGTPMYKSYEDKITEKKYENFNQYKLVYEHKILNDKKINDLKSYAYKQFYFRFKKIPIIIRSFLSLFR